MSKLTSVAVCAACLLLSAQAQAQTQAQTQTQTQTQTQMHESAGATARAPYDADLARSLGADDNGMKRYVLVILKTGPNQVPAGPQRDEMFKGHFANMGRLSAQGKLALAGPLDGVDGWRGLFVFAVPDVDEARKYVETDPVIIEGEMVAEYHTYYGSAALMLVRDAHQKISKKR